MPQSNPQMVRREDPAALLEEQEFDFGSVHTDNFPAILKGLKISLAVTSYQSQRLFFIRSRGNGIDTNFKFFPRPMGVYADRERLTLGTLTQVVEFKRNEPLLRRIKQGELDNPEEMTKKVLEKDSEKMRELREQREHELAAVKKADALYLSRAALTTGMINIHDIAWGDSGLWVVNSTFSCLATLSPSCSFVARWKPPFISRLAPEDRCHLNGVAMMNGRPKYVTTFNRSDQRDSWVRDANYDGTLIDVDSNEILLEGLSMPHSPRCYRGSVYVCDSGRGEILKYDPRTGDRTVVIKLHGFPRGMNFFGPLMFVGLSQVRPSENRKPPPIAAEFGETLSGVWIINLEDHQEVGHLRFTGDVQQIYDIAVIPDAVYPEMININDTLIRHTFEYKEIKL